MRITPMGLDEVLIIEPDVYRDHRGFFTETYNAKKLSEYGINIEFLQDNHSLTVEAGTIRGLHYQLPPNAQTKLIRATAGAIYDVAVDIRKSSSTYGQWVGAILTAENHRQLLIPKGFAHGFCTLVSNTEVNYKVDAYYAPESDAGILWSDASIGIDWPFSQVTLSAKDESHSLLIDAEIFD